jgi:hypothetical protein
MESIVKVRSVDDGNSAPRMRLGMASSFVSSYIKHFSIAGMIETMLSRRERTQQDMTFGERL